MFNEFPYTNYEKINLDWLLDLGNKLKADAESGEFDGERGKGIFGITTIYQENNQYYAFNPGGVTVGDFIIGYGPSAGTNILYIMKVTSVTGNYVNGTSIIRITGPQGPQGQQGEPGEGGLTEAMKQALLQLARKVAYIDENGQTYYQALYNSFYTPADLLSISAVYTQSGTVYNTDALDNLKTDLVVTAHYSDSSSQIVPDAAYTLSGILTVGTSVITVSYGGKTTTFNVVVSEGVTDTTAQIAQYGLISGGGGETFAVVNGGITIKYSIPNTTILYPAGVIVEDGLMRTNRGSLRIFKDNTYVNYLDLVNRWAKSPAASYTEFHDRAWTVNEYNQIEFSVDTRYLADSYMYDYTTGLIFFAGSNTPYYGKENVND